MGASAPRQKTDQKCRLQSGANARGEAGPRCKLPPRYMNNPLARQRVPGPTRCRTVPAAHRHAARAAKPTPVELEARRPATEARPLHPPVSPDTVRTRELRPAVSGRAAARNPRTRPRPRAAPAYGPAPVRRAPTARWRAGRASRRRTAARARPGAACGARDRERPSPPRTGSGALRRPGRPRAIRCSTAPSPAFAVTLDTPSRKANPSSGARPADCTRATQEPAPARALSDCARQRGRLDHGAVRACLLVDVGRCRHDVDLAGRPATHHAATSRLGSAASSGRRAHGRRDRAGAR